MGFGYANLGLPGATENDTQHRSGFSMLTNLNFTPHAGIDNFLGYYSLGDGSTLFTNVIGGRWTFVRTDKVAPFVVAGLGGGQVTIKSGGYYYDGGSGFAWRGGGGFDYKLSDVIGTRFDISKLQIRSGGVWVGKSNISVGVIFTIMQ